jgi:hypothetical protein
MNRKPAYCEHVSVERGCGAPARQRPQSPIPKAKARGCDGRTSPVTKNIIALPHGQTEFEFTIFADFATPTGDAAARVMVRADEPTACWSASGEARTDRTVRSHRGPTKGAQPFGGYLKG